MSSLEQCCHYNTTCRTQYMWVDVKNFKYTLLNSTSAANLTTTTTHYTQTWLSHHHQHH